MNTDLLRDKVAKEIISLISSGVYRQGRRIPSERGLSEQFNISRGTIRQALSVLAKVGVIKIRRNSGAYVGKLMDVKIPVRYLPPDFPKVSLEDVIIARESIELSAAGLACKKIVPKDIQKLEMILKGMKENQANLVNFLRLDMEFHRTIVVLSENRVLLTAFDAIYEYHKYSQIFSSYKKGEVESTLRHHQNILDGLKNSDVKSSGKALSRHLKDMKRYVGKNGRI